MPCEDRPAKASGNPETYTQLKLAEPIPVSKPTWASKYISASKDLMFEGTRFHEFASGEQQPDDWIIEDASVPKQRLTMSDVFQKEEAIRKLGKEALEDDLGDDEDEDEDDGEDEEGNEDGNDGGEEDDEYIDEDEDDDGYDTDTEHGFADSDDDFDHTGEELFEIDVPVWFPRQNPETRVSPRLEIYRPATSLESDSSVFSAANVRVIPTRRMQISRGKHNLPDSTDFVCGTFDEDRVAEDMYLTVVAARKRSKLHTIPQDIDPSFPTSEPEDEDDNGDVSKSGNYDSDEHVLLHGELEDIHHSQERPERRHRRSDARSPRIRLRPPPPKKHNSSPALRGRSPRPLFGRTSPRHLRSPPPAQTLRSPRASPVHRAGGTAYKPLAARPGLTTTKSLPRHTGMFLKARRKATHQGKNGHTRGAIDIVKGLEQKRQRRREKYLQKYCDRARKGQIPEKKPVLPGQGAERMRELGLYMAGKLGPDYVLSI